MVRLIERNTIYNYVTKQAIVVLSQLIEKNSGSQESLCVVEIVCRKGVHPSLFYRWKKQFLEGGKRVVEILRQLPPTVGHRRVWLKLRGEGLSRNTVWRLMKEMVLLLSNAELPGYQMTRLKWLALGNRCAS
jgi:transposase-like protein